jgi:hypothetical protein
MGLGDPLSCGFFGNNKTHRPLLPPPSLAAKTEFHKKGSTVFNGKTDSQPQRLVLTIRLSLTESK